MTSLGKYQGCFLGLAMGDTYGAAFEGGLIERTIWKLINTTKEGKLRYTDDTQMSIDLAESFLKNNKIDQTELATTFANSYQWSRGYGPAAGWLLKKIRKGGDWKTLNRAQHKEGSYGNGAAMRSPIVALCFPNENDNFVENIKKAAEITHCHPLGIEGASLIAHVTRSALHDWQNSKILDALSIWATSEAFAKKAQFCKKILGQQNPVSLETIKSKLGNGISAQNSCMTAIYFALKYREADYTNILCDICSLGGDTDTIGAMAGGIWGAFHGIERLDTHKAQRIENYDTILSLATCLHESRVQ